MGLNRQLANLPDAITTDTSNNVGIGGSPSGSYKLDVTGTGRFTGQLHIPNNSTGTNAGLFFDYNANAASRSWCIVSDYDAYGDFQIKQSTTQTGTTFSKILGFSPTGAATFSGKTNVVKDIADYAFTVTNTNTSGYGMYLQAGSTNNAIDVYNASGSTQLFKLTGTGAATFSSLAGSGSRTVTADASGTLSASSDSSLKQEDKEYKIQGLSEVLQLKPRAYKWLNDIEIRGEEATTEIGFFADEVNPIIPSAAPKGNDGLYGFYDRAVIAALVNSIQEQQATITSLQNRLDKLENK